ncbi:MAG: cell division protein FtsZ [Alphaproteobacteria bacterium]|nr:cell division protein FtsZ [Alphaproteobacteria bacterium]
MDHKSNDLNIGLPEVVPEILMTPNICVIGVGGAGGNAINNMIESGLTGTRFVVANTDAQVMAKSLTHERIQLGAAITQGLGAGSNPEIGKAAAEESAEKIKEALQGVNLLFIAAGMGGGTGTGASPVVAKIAKDMGILTVGVVTKPFRMEGNKRTRVAEAGIQELSKYVDTLITIPNQNLFLIAKPQTTIKEAFKMADDILYQGVKSITDLMITTMEIHVDFADFKTVTQGMGKAIMGSGEASGENRALEATEKAIVNPLLDVSMKGAKGVLISLSGKDISLTEAEEATERIRQEVDEDANIIFGICLDENLGDKIRVSVVATGLEQNKEPQTPETTHMLDENEPVIITPNKPEEKQEWTLTSPENPPLIIVPAAHEEQHIQQTEEADEEIKSDYPLPPEETFIPVAPVEAAIDEEELEKQSAEPEDSFVTLVTSLSEEKDGGEEKKEMSVSTDAPQQQKEKKHGFWGDGFFPGFWGEKNLVEKSKKRLKTEEAAMERKIPQLPDEEELNIPAFLRR